MPWTDGQPFRPGETRSPYAHRWLETLDPTIRERLPNDPSDLPRVRHMEIVERNGHLTAEIPVDSAAQAAPRARIGDLSLAGIVAQSAEENGPVPIALPGTVFSTRRAASVQWTAPPVVAPPKGGVIIAVIDDAIGFANERFRKGGRGVQTRFDYVWLQGVADPQGASDLPFGRELDGAAINALLAQFQRGNRIDEPGLYRHIGYIDFSQSSVQTAASAASHGTSVADRAGGDGGGGAAGPHLTDVDEITLMGVSLPSQIIGDTAGTFIELFIILAIERILQRVRWLEAQAGLNYSLVVNLSFALTAGAQHGRGLLDTYLRVAVANYHAHLPAAQRLQLVFVGPAGNHRQARTHARVAPVQGAHPPLFWHLLPDDRTLSFIEVWSDPHPHVPAPTIHCALRPPGVTGQLPVPGIVAFGDSADFIVNGRKYAEAHYTWYPNNPANPGGPGHQRIVVSVNPTTADWPGQPIAPSGDWGVEIIGATVPVDIRVQRDDSLAGYRQRGRQSYLVDSTYADYDAAGRPFLLNHVAGLVTRTGTVNQLFTARLPNIHVISAHARLGQWRGAPATRGVEEMAYSGEGAPARASIGVREIADATLVHRGIVTAGTLGGSAAIVSGTSIAAPWATREIALQLINWAPGTPMSNMITPLAPTLGPVPRVRL
jgi:hypothetical protein